MGDISSVIQILALGAFLLGFMGIALVVSGASQGRSVRNGALLGGVGLLGGVILLVISQGLLVVDTTERAVVFNSVSGQLETPREPGIHIIIPGIQQVTLYPISQQSYTMAESSEGLGSANVSDAIEARSVDGQEVRVDLTILFRLSSAADDLNRIHVDWRNEPGGYRDGLIRPTVRSVVRDVVANFIAEELYGRGREEMQNEIQTRLRTSLSARGIVMTDLLVRAINFTPQFTDAIERKQIEEQELQRARTEAERVRTEAAGRAEAAIEQARGEAQAILVRAAAEAEALRLISEQIAANPNLIQYTYIQTLADNITLALVPANSPFLFDANSFLNLGSDFEAPDVPFEIPTPAPTEAGSGS
jgi:regulator of protease activity HflC (stomatin/prohibitin superfamily)